MNPFNALPVKSISRAWGRERGVVVSCRAYPCHEAVAIDADTHVAAMHECNSAKHLFLQDVVTAVEYLANALGDTFVESHGYSGL